MRRLGLVLMLSALTVPAAGAASFKPFAFHGTVLAAPTSASRYVAASDGEIYLVFVPRRFAIGTTVAVRGMRPETDRYLVWATPPDGSVRSTGRATKVVVRAHVGFIDESRGRFQLGAHGQVVGWVRYPKRLGPQLKLASRQHASVTRRFRLGLAHGRLTLLAVVR
jgi:hypothetical protein